MVGVLVCLFPIPYKSIAQLISVLILAFALYMEGGISNEISWNAKINELKLELAAKETQSVEITTKIITKYVDRVKIVKETGDVIIKEIPKYITTIDDSKCTIPNGFVMLHNSAASNELPDSSRDFNAGASEIKISGVATIVIENYNTYYQLAEQLKSLQSWVKEQQLLYKKD